MASYKIEHDRPNCIGCSACVAVCPKFWDMDGDGKSSLKGGTKRNDGWEEMNIEESDYASNLEAAQACPVNVIHLVEKESKKKII